MSKVHKFLVDFFHLGAVKYAAGSCYEANDETELAVSAGHAVEIEDGDQELAHPFGRAPAQPPVPPTSTDEPAEQTEPPTEPPAA